MALLCQVPYALQYTGVAFTGPVPGQAFVHSPLCPLEEPSRRGKAPGRSPPPPRLLCRMGTQKPS